MGASFQRFSDLLAWQRAHELVLGCYRESRVFPREEMYGLISQLRRSAASTATNIVEGSKRRTTADLCHFLTTAQGSNEETKYHLLLARDLGHLREDRYRALSGLAEEVSALLYRLLQSLESRR